MLFKERVSEQTIWIMEILYKRRKTDESNCFLSVFFVLEFIFQNAAAKHYRVRKIAS